ncbi:MAG: alpha/beta hydrolase [Zoogloeaceae bacterium]|jgi:pimeloyl-ACP methyl ester carboxylesterase|nr:alpha/beta hydrolase [Zoogloeaceae bacterium]
MTDFLTLAPDGKTQTLEIAWITPPHVEPDAPPLVFLHEGLGCVALWRQFPARLCAAVSRRGLLYSRYGYGASTPRPHDQPLPVDYLEREARVTLPALLAALDIENPWLIGHSDGGSIALLAAAAFPDVFSGIVTLAPHYCVEEKCLFGIEEAKAAYEHGGLREKLARYHDDPDSAFCGWYEVWLNPARRDWNIAEDLRAITCPVLALQGREDEYATLDQIEAIARAALQTELRVLEDCGHFPFLTAPETTEAAIAAFIRAQG